MSPLCFNLLLKTVDFSSLALFFVHSALWCSAFKNCQLIFFFNLLFPLAKTPATLQPNFLHVISSHCWVFSFFGFTVFCCSCFQRFTCLNTCMPVKMLVFGFYFSFPFISWVEECWIRIRDTGKEKCAGIGWKSNPAPHHPDHPLQ